MGETFTVVRRSEIAANAWDACVDNFDEAWLFHRSEVIDMLALWPNYEDASFALIDRTGALRAIVPLHRIAYKRFRGIASFVRYESHGGFAIDRSGGPALYAALRQAVVDHLDAVSIDAAATRVRLSPMAPAWRGAGGPRTNPLLEAGFAPVAAHSWVIDLSPEPEEIRRRYSHGARSDLKKAAKLDGTVRAAGPSDLETCHALHVETYLRTGARPMPLEAWRVIFERALSLGLLRVLVFARQGRVLAMHTTGIFKNAAIYWNGASSDACSGGENRLLFDAQIMAARAAGCVLFDAGDAFPGASDAKNKGLSDFKGSFGGTLWPLWCGERHGQRLVQRMLRASREVRDIMLERR